MHNVCIMLEENLPFKVIIEKTGFSDNKISKILNKRTHTNISDKYDFSNYSYGKPLNYEEVIHKIRPEFPRGTFL